MGCNGRRAVLYRVRMTGEAADFAECFLLEEHVTRCRYNLFMLKSRHA